MSKFNAAFWKWFGDSKVVDKKGRPLVVYHGTDQHFDIFEKLKINEISAASGFFFSGSRSDAKGYGKIVIKAFLTIKEPIYIDSFDYKKIDSAVKSIGKRHDGIIVKNYANGYISAYVVFDPAQIKSVDNDRTWDADDHSIRSNPPVLSDQDRRYYGLTKYNIGFDPEFKIKNIGSRGELIANFDEDNYSGEYEYLYEMYKNGIDVDPIIVVDNGHIIDGWHRTGAAAKAGLKTVPAFVVAEDEYGVYGEIS